MVETVGYDNCPMDCPINIEYDVYDFFTMLNKCNNCPFIHPGLRALEAFSLK